MEAGTIFYVSDFYQCMPQARHSPLRNPDNRCILMCELQKVERFRLFQSCLPDIVPTRIVQIGLVAFYPGEVLA